MPTISQALEIALRHHQAGRLAAASLIYRQILAAEPDHTEALHLLGVIAQQEGRPEEAIAHIERAIGLKDNQASYHNNLGEAYRAVRNIPAAIACYQRALQLGPDSAEPHNNLGNALQEQGRLAEAIACYQRALQLRPDYVEAHNNLGNVWERQGRPDEAVACYQRALQRKPDFAEALNNLGNALRHQGQIAESIDCYQRAVQLKPDYAMAHNNLGSSWKELGDLERALACYRRALECDPGLAAVHSNLVYSLHFCPGYNAQALYEAHRDWSRQHAEPLRRFVLPHDNSRLPQRRLRVGYVSPDFRAHAVGLFLLPLLEAHDHRQFEIFCYSGVVWPDDLTGRLRASADVWREIVGRSDEQAAELIRRDQIDVLVDLTMHLADNRLLLFARKPAPVQVTYLAYCGTTGLETMDYRLTDPYLDPPGGDEPFYAEQSIRLPESYWCYRPVEPAPAVSGLPALRSGQVTFGCLNNFCKASAATLAAWRCLLEALPESRLILHAHPGRHRDRVRDLLTGPGGGPDRVQFVPRLPTADYFRIYDEIDLALDPFPYGGGTTTCDALWMGVPVVSLAGETAVGRGGLSILSNVGLAELVARDCEQYVQIAAELAGDLPRLARLRATLRQRMQDSPLMDAPRFARHIEAAYRGMWQRWCGE